MGRKYGEGHHDGVAAEGMVFLRNERFSLQDRGKRKHAERLKGRAP